MERSLKLKKMASHSIECQILPPMSNLEAVKCDISYQWMTQFEQMHQDRLQTTKKIAEERAKADEKFQTLEAKYAKQKEKISRLETDLDKSNSVIREMKRLLRDQRKVFDACSNQMKINYRQNQMLNEQRKEIRRLRLLNLRSKQFIRKLRNEQKVPTQIKSENPQKVEKPKYTQDDLKQAVQAVLAGQSLGKASSMFNVPKETLRQAKMKAQL